MKSVAFVGLGVMGRPMSGNLAKAGFSVRTFDAKVKGSCGSVREAVKGAEALITMLPDGAAVRDVVLDALPHLPGGAVVIDMSSSDPAGTRALGKALAARGLGMVDAPVSGAVVGARAATLAIMVGADDALFEKARPLLAAMGSQLFHVGPLGAGHAVKALNNYLGAAGTLAGFEALLVARAFGLDPRRMLEAINASTGRNSTTERKIGRDILTGTFASGFKLALMAKDVGIAAELARGLGVETPYLRFTLKTWESALRTLPAGADHVEIYKYQERLARGAKARRKATPKPSRARRTRARQARG